MSDLVDEFLATRERSPEKTLLADGESVGGWTVRGLIGRGGSAEVYHVVDASGASAALKMMTKSSDDPVAHRHFERECLVLSAGLGVHFPHWHGRGVVRGHDYLVEELLLPYDELPQGRRAVRRYLSAVCEGVAQLHAYGFVHRDLKPSNIMRRRGADGADVPVLVDFGLAAPPTNGETPSADRTMVGGRVVVAGTPGYAAPEAFAGGEITAASDLHALGVVAAKCFGGKVPFGWRTLVRRATSSLPVQRYASAAAFAKALRATSPMRFVAVWLVLLVLVAVIVGLVVSRRSKPTPTPSVSPSSATSSPSQAESRRPDATGEMNAHDQKLLKEMLRERANRRIGVGDW